MNDKQFDCVINGAGMIGATAALALAELGLKVAIIDKYAPKPFSAEQAYDLRVSAISYGSELLLKQLNIWPQLNQWRLCPYQRLGVGEASLAYTEFNATSIDAPHLGHIIENRLIQLSAWQQIETNPNITLLCPETLVAIEYLPVGIKLELSDSVIETKLLLGADGANSQVRQLANIGSSGWQYQQAAMLINVDTEGEQQDITWQQFFETGPVAMLPLAGNKASLVWYHSIEEIKRLAQLSNEQLTQAISQTFPAKLGKVTVRDKAWFPLTRRHAHQYVKPHIALLGDAAHTINPLAGQGVNLGFKDVKALRQVIAEAIAKGQAWHSLATLKKYQQARRLDNFAMMTAMDGLYCAFSHPSPVVKAIRNAAISVTGKMPFVKNKALAYACGI